MAWDHDKDGPEHAFHIGGGFFFDKGKDGQVVLTMRNGPEDIILSVIPGTEWASVVAHVSKSGETTAAYYKALDFHKNGA